MLRLWNKLHCQRFIIVKVRFCWQQRWLFPTFHHPKHLLYSIEKLSPILQLVQGPLQKIHVIHCNLDFIICFGAPWKKQKYLNRWGIYLLTTVRVFYIATLDEIPGNKSDTLHWFSNCMKLKVISYRTKIA